MIVPPPGAPSGIINRPQQTRLGVDEGDDLLLVPDVIAGGDDLHAGAQQVDRDPRRDPAASGGVLAVDDGEIELPFLLQLRKPRDDRAAAGLAHDVAEEKNFKHRRASYYTENSQRR